MPPAGRSAVVLLLAAASLTAAAGSERTVSGVRPDRPLGVITPGPWRGLFLDLPLADARAGAEPDLTVRWWMANSWSIPTLLERGGRRVEVQQDEQSDVLEVTARMGWANLLGEGPTAGRLSTAAAWRLTQHWGGWSDRPIEAWHRLAGLNDFDRSQGPRDAVRLTLREPGGAAAVALTGPRLAAGDLVLRTSCRLLEGGRPDRGWATVARLDVKVPTGRLADAGGSGGLDLGLGLGASGMPTGWLTGHVQLTAARLAPLPSALPLQPARWQVGGELSLAAALAGGWVLLAERRALSPLFAGTWSLVEAAPHQSDAVAAITRWQNQITVGVRKGPVAAWLSEDFTPGRRREAGPRWFYDTNAPDLVLGLAIGAP
jgi:hypothetical protein